MVNFKARHGTGTQEHIGVTWLMKLCVCVWGGGGKIYSASLPLLKGNTDVAILSPVKRRFLFLFILYTTKVIV